MKSKLLIKERLEIKGLAFKVHSINADDNKEGGWSRQVQIYSGLLGRSLTRWATFWNEKKIKTHKSKLRFDRWHKDDEELHFKQQRRMIADYGESLAKITYPDFETIEHDSIYDFLEYIGYDYKNKKVSNTDTLIMIEKK